MDELPQSAKRLLALARTADEPSDAARERVRRGVAIAIGASGALAAGSAASRAAASTTAATKLSLVSSTSAKLALVVATAATVGAVAWVQHPRSAPTAQHAAAPHVTTAPQAHAQPTAPAVVVPAAQAPAPESAAPEARAPEAAPVQPRVRASFSGTAPALRGGASLPSAHRVAATRSAAPDQSLRAEMTLLSEASAALDRGDLAQARALLASHHTRFAAGQLREERRGLEVLTRCVANQTGAVAAASAYLRTAPDAVLAARIASACKLEKP